MSRNIHYIRSLVIFMDHGLNTYKITFWNVEFE